MANTGNESARLIRPAWLATLVLVGTIGLLALWLRSGLIGAEQWPIRWLDIDGELRRASASQIRAAVARPAQRGFFGADLGEVRAAVEGLPWVARAEVSRHWPDALLVRVTEHRPVARWNDRRLLSDQGEEFDVDGSDGMQGLARLHGPQALRSEVFETWQQMRRRLAGAGLDIVRLEVDARGAWQARLDTGLTVIFGRENIHERLARFLSVYPALQRDERWPERIDMRYTNGLAVRWRQSSSGVSEQHG